MANLRMPSINQVAIAGRLTHDPEFRITETGKARLSFSIALNLHYRDRNDEWQEETTFVPVVVWEKLAEWGADQFKKGSAIFLTGRLKSRTYESNNGNRTLLEIVARSIQVLEKKTIPLT